MRLKELYSHTRRALDDYHMIAPGDKIAIGISGGKDSLTLLTAMAGLQRFYPIPFSLEAVTVSLGFPDTSWDVIASFCEDLSVPYTVIPTEIAKIVFQDREEHSPCSLCSKLRKGAFNRKAKELGCNKIAYAHHLDDTVDTLLLSLLFEGQIHTFRPVTYLDRSELTLIRPLLYLPEHEIASFARAKDFPVKKNPCPVDGYTKRQYVKDLAEQIEQQYPGVKDRMFHAILTGPIDGWKERKEENDHGTQLS